jgi:hypothetical protein
MAVLMAYYSGVTGGAYPQGRAPFWSEGGQLVAASMGTEEVLVIGVKQNGVWKGSVAPLA